MRIPLLILCFGLLVLPLLAEDTTIVYRTLSQENLQKPPKGETYEELILNSQGKILRARVFLAPGVPGTSFGIHRYEYTYDAAGNQTSESYFGEHDELMCVMKAHTLKWTYDQGGRETSRTCWGAHDEPVADELAIHRTEWTYNAQGQDSSKAFYDVDGKPTVDQFGNHRYEWTYDAEGKETGFRKLDAEGKERE